MVHWLSGLSVISATWEYFSFWKSASNLGSALQKADNKTHLLPPSPHGPEPTPVSWRCVYTCEHKEAAAKFTIISKASWFTIIVPYDTFSWGETPTSLIKSINYALLRFPKIYTWSPICLIMTAWHLKALFMEYAENGVVQKLIFNMKSCHGLLYVALADCSFLSTPSKIPTSQGWDTQGSKVSQHFQGTQVRFHCSLWSCAYFCFWIIAGLTTTLFTAWYILEVFTIFILSCGLLSSWMLE